MSGAEERSAPQAALVTVYLSTGPRCRSRKPSNSRIISLSGGYGCVGMHVPLGTPVWCAKHPKQGLPSIRKHFTENSTEG